MVKKNMNEGKKGAEKNQRKNIRTQQSSFDSFILKLISSYVVMVIFKINMFIIVIVLAVLFSGCTGVQNATTTSAQPKQTSTMAQMTALPTTVKPILTPGTVAVEIKGFAFVPATITISKGTTVIWTQKDSVTHTVTGTGFDSSEISFDSGELSQGQTFSHTFNEVGTFNYGCLFHPSMSGQIIVT